MDASGSMDMDETEAAAAQRWAAQDAPALVAEVGRYRDAVLTLLDRAGAAQVACDSDEEVVLPDTAVEEQPGLEGGGDDAAGDGADNEGGASYVTCAAAGVLFRPALR
jgi:hypothetical protein